MGTSQTNKHSQRNKYILGIDKVLNQRIYLFVHLVHGTFEHNDTASSLSLSLSSQLCVYIMKMRPNGT
jgi:hypothetical protein